MIKHHRGLQSRIQHWLRSRNDTGLWGEKRAERFLQEKGYRILHHRFRNGPREEIDLIARLDETLVFVEVKTRASEIYGRPASAVNAAKKKAISRAAARFMMRAKQRPPYFRFDIVEVVGSRSSGVKEIRHIEQAFTMSGGYRF